MIYISGKISGDEEFKGKFAEAERKIKETVGKYDTVYNPALVDLGENAKWADYMKVDIPILLQCHTVIMLSDWKESIGAWLEREIAKALGLKVMEYRDLFKSEDGAELPEVWKR